MADSEVCIAAWLEVLLEVQQTHYDGFCPLYCRCLIRITQQRLLKNTLRMRLFADVISVTATQTAATTSYFMLK